MPQCPKYATMPQICNIAGGRNFDIFLIFQKCPKNAPQGPGGPWGSMGLYFSPIFGSLGPPLGGPWGGPVAPLFSLSWAAVAADNSRDDSLMCIAGRPWARRCTKCLNACPQGAALFSACLVRQLRLLSRLLSRQQQPKIRKIAKNSGAPQGGAQGTQKWWENNGK